MSCMRTWQQNVKIVCRNGHSPRRNCWERKPWRETFHMQHPLQPKNIAGLYSNNELANSLQFFLNVQRGVSPLIWGWWTIIVTTKNAIWIWDTQNDALEKRRLLANVAGYKNRHCTAGKRGDNIPAAEQHTFLLPRCWFLRNSHQVERCRDSHWLRPPSSSGSGPSIRCFVEKISSFKQLISCYR